MTKPEQDYINNLATKNGLSRAGAVAYHYGTAKYLYQKETERSQQQNEAGSGRADKVKTAEEFVRAVENVNKGVHQGFKTVQEAFPGISKDQVSKAFVANPIMGKLFTLKPDGTVEAKPGYEIVKDFNRLAVDIKPEVKSQGGFGNAANPAAPEVPIFTQFAVRDTKTGNITVAAATDDDFAAGKFKMSPPIPKEDVNQKLIFPALWNGGKYNPIDPSSMQTALGNMGYDIKNETINEANKKFIYADDPDTQGGGSSGMTEKEKKAKDDIAKQLGL
jgi:hypothetical protein